MNAKIVIIFNNMQKNQSFFSFFVQNRIIFTF